MSNVELKDEEIKSEQKFDNCDDNSHEELVDPRVQVELERLNTATDLINKLEIELDEARSNFRLLLNDSSIRVNQLAKKLGSCVEKARPYYEARMRAKQLQTQTQKAALRYERASSAHSAAKEMVYLAEEGLKKEGRCFDPAWQEMLNHATLRVNEAESERVLSQHEHQKLSSAYNDAEKIVQKLHQELKKSIVKSRPYFEMKAQFNQLLEEQRKKVHHLEENVLKIKMSYADALHNLEEISDEIHQKRKSKEELNEQKEGVGAETSNFAWNSIEIPYHKLTSNSTSCEEIYYDNLNSEDMYRSLPSKLKVRPSVVNATCPRFEQQVAISKTSCFPESHENPEPDDSKSETLKENFSSNETVLHNDKCNDDYDKNAANIKIDRNSSIISKQIEHLSLSNGEDQNPAEKPSLVRGKSPDGEEVPDHKFLAPDFNILRVQREEISDSESLASNDTADTLDDNQIECLLLDRILPLDVESDMENSYSYK